MLEPHIRGLVSWLYFHIYFLLSTKNVEILPLFQYPVRMLFYHKFFFRLFTFRKRAFLMAMHIYWAPCWSKSMFHSRDRYWLLSKGSNFSCQLLDGFHSIYFVFNNRVFAFSSSCHFWCANSFSRQHLLQFLVAFVTNIAPPVLKYSNSWQFVFESSLPQ